MRRTSLLLLLACSCGVRTEALLDTSHPQAQREAEVLPPSVEVPLPDAFEAAPDPSERLGDASLATGLTQVIDEHFERYGSRRVHVQLDRPMYRPGDTVWVAAYSLMSRGLTADSMPTLTLELVDAQGSVVQTANVGQARGVAHHALDIPAGTAGGKWTLRARTLMGDVEERPFVVSAYQTPRIQKELDFVREGYGAGEVVEALVGLKTPSGAPLAQHPVTILLQVAGNVVYEGSASTDEDGDVFVRAELPDDLDAADGLLTVFVEDAGITESISRSVPLLLDEVEVSLFPEGGDLVADMPGRVYVEVTNAFGEPADVSGEVRDDQGKVVAEFTTLHDGMGRFAFTPELGRDYRVHITSTAGHGTVADVPEALAEGCVLRSYDDIDSQAEAVRVGVRCTSHADVAVTAVLQETVLDAAMVRVGPDHETIVHLTPDADMATAQGAVRVTVFNTDRMPLAERLIYRNAGADLDVDISVDRDTYGPRDEVVARVVTRNAVGEPVPATLSLAVVDEAVLALADDEEGTINSRVYLEPELMESPEDPAFYFDDDEALASRGLDLLMGTKGWRRFDWTPVFNPPPEMSTAKFADGFVQPAAGDVLLELAEEEGMLAALGYVGVGMGGGGAVVGDAFGMGGLAGGALEQQALLVARPQGAARERRRSLADAPGIAANRGEPMMHDMDMLWAAGGHAEQWQQAAPVRVFPAPDYREGFTGVRTDFRDTVHWAPAITTDDDGVAEVRFYLSDATTAFRLTAEGIADGIVGRGETTMASVLPVSVDTQLPSFVSAGDELWIPLTATNTRPEAMRAHAHLDVGSDIVRLDTSDATLDLDADSSDTAWFPVTIGEGSEVASLTLQVDGGSAHDTAVHELTVVPPGFPRSWSTAGEMTGQTELSVHVDEYTTGSLTAEISWQPSPTATLIKGMDALIRTPGGCFEQTSSTNWPNVAIIKYLEANGGDASLRAKSAQALSSGYERLTGYQVSAGGFETFGSGPGKEVLSAFGLLQFTDMASIHPVDDAMLDRDVDYLLGVRDGNGGYTNSGESAHGYGSAPADVLNGFITWALVASGHADELTVEIDAQADVARTSTDPYVLALAARTLVATEHVAAERAVERLASLQAEDGSFPGAVSSITRSYEANLLVESTALAALALMDANTARPAYDAAAEWLVSNRRGVGSWGATQATALALETLTRHAELSRRPATAGRLQVVVNGDVVGEVSYDADETEPLALTGWEDALVVGDNTVVLRQLEGEPLPFTANVAWISIEPDTSPGAELGLTTALSTAEARLGDTVRLTATLSNRTDAVVPSPIARIGLPAGLEAQTWQLEELQERGLIAFFETRPREVTLYWEGVHADAQHEVVLDLVARNAGRFTGPASSAYPYYDDDEMAWQPGLRVAIAR